MKKNRRNRKLLWIRERNKFRKGVERCRGIVRVSDRVDETIIHSAIMSVILSFSKKYKILLHPTNITAGKTVDEMYNDFTEQTTTIIFDIVKV